MSFNTWDQYSVRTNLVFRAVASLFLLLISMHPSLLLYGGGDSVKTARPERALHLILFEDYPYTVSSDTNPRPYNVVDLPSAEFPQQFSCMYAPFRKLQKFALPEGVEIPRKVILLDIHTLSEAELNRKTVLYHNPLIDLSYQLKVTDWGDDSYQIGLSGKYRGFEFADIPIAGQLDRTKLVTIRRTSRQTLFAVFTPLQAIPLFSAEEYTGPGDFQEPRLIEAPQPKYPKGISRAGKVILRGVITPGGRLDPDRFVLLECAHPLLGESALETILNDWKFQPGTKDGVPVEALATIEVQFVPE